MEDLLSFSSVCGVIAYVLYDRLLSEYVTLVDVSFGCGMARDFTPHISEATIFATSIGAEVWADEDSVTIPVTFKVKRFVP